MKYTNESIGSKLIETITSGLYDGNRNCLREYVQNSIDAKAYNIFIYFENENNLIIRDDGYGMDNIELERALSVGISNKSDDNIGWRGIGIWSGVPACKKIVILTKKRNSKKFRVEINNDILRKGSTTNLPFLEILENATGEIEELTLGKNESFEDDHFTEIRLESILFTQKAVFSRYEVIKYLCENVPAPFNEKAFPLGKEINQWLNEYNLVTPNVNILFENKKIFRNPNRIDVFFPEIIKKEFRINDELIAISWLLSSKENKTLPESNVGIFFKKKGFTIGDSSLVEKLNPEESYTRWQYGEIHIISKYIIENAARNGFELNNPYVEPFLIEIGKFVKELQNLNRFQSDKIQTKAVAKAQNYLEKGKTESAMKAIEKAKNTIDKSRKSPSESALKNMERRIDGVSETNLRDLNELEAKIKGTPSDQQQFVNKEKYIMHPDPSKEGFIAEKPQEASNQSTLPAYITSIPEEKIEPLLDSILKNIHPKVNAYVSRSKKSGLEHFEMSATDAIKNILMEKVGSGLESTDEPTISHLSRIAYGWGDVTQTKKNPILAIDKNFPARNWRFGAMIYTIHDLFINMYKHERGTDSFKWYDESSPNERKILVAEAYAMIDLIYRLIEKSEYNE